MFSNSNLLFAIIFVTLLLVVMIGGILLSLFLIKRQQLNYAVQMKDRELEYEREMREAQAAVSDTMMAQLSRELHDGINPLLMQAQLTLGRYLIGKSTGKENLEAAYKQVNEAIDGVRLLSRSLNTDIVSRRGLVRSLETEIERLNALQQVVIRLQHDGQELGISAVQQLMLFRIFQEAIANTLKHAAATEVRVSLLGAASFLFSIEDNGQGFSYDVVMQGKEINGLRNIDRRAEIAGFEHRVITAPGMGCRHEFLRKPHTS